MGNAASEMQHLANQLQGMGPEEKKFLQAVFEGKNTEAVAALQANPNLIYARSGAGINAWHISAERGDLSMLDSLATHSKGSRKPIVGEPAPVNFKSRKGQTPLMVACQEGHQEGGHREASGGARQRRGGHDVELPTAPERCSGRCATSPCVVTAATSLCDITDAVRRHRATASRQRPTSAPPKLRSRPARRPAADVVCAGGPPHDPGGQRMHTVAAACPWCHAGAGDIQEPQIAMQMMLAIGANVLDTDNYGNTCIHYAAYKGQMKILEILLNSSEADGDGESDNR
ncbi:MAG: hypothetical protein WDW38_007449 [Sanguina aurantia]